MKPFHLLGKSGEDRGVKFLTSLGYKIIDRNFRTRFGEIDIIAKDKDILVFVEVKTRSDKTFGTPEDSITPRKLDRLLKACHYFNLKNGTGSSPQRIDVLAIDDPHIRHIKNITL